MAKLSKLAINSNLADEGVWVDFGDGLKFKIARKGNAAYQKALMNHPKIKPYLKNLSAISNDVFKQVENEVKAEYVLVDWVGLEGDDGKEIKYSPKAALDLIFADPNQADTVDKIEKLSDSYETFRQEEIAEISKS